jgi:hypothetical protein
MNPWLMSLAPTNGAIRYQGALKRKTARVYLVGKKRWCAMTKRKCFVESGDLYTFL